MNNYNMDLSLQGETFAGLKMDFDMMLASLIKDMEEKGVNESTLTMKLNVTLMPMTVPTYDGIREATVPVFRHEVSSAMTVKNRVTGRTGDGTELVYDDRTGLYSIRRIDDGQMCLDEGGGIIHTADDDEGIYDYEEPEK